MPSHAMPLSTAIRTLVEIITNGIPEVRLADGAGGTMVLGARLAGDPITGREGCTVLASHDGVHEWQTYEMSCSGEWAFLCPLSSLGAILHARLSGIGPSAVERMVTDAGWQEVEWRERQASSPLRRTPGIGRSPSPLRRMAAMLLAS